MWRREVDPIYVAYTAGVSIEASYACDGVGILLASASKLVIS
jgi:hypothetical protein